MKTLVIVHLRAARAKLLEWQSGCEASRLRIARTDPQTASEERDEVDKIERAISNVESAISTVEAI